jgi:hypothetical protein
MRSYAQHGWLSCLKLDSLSCLRTLASRIHFSTCSALTAPICEGMESVYVDDGYGIPGHHLGHTSPPQPWPGQPLISYPTE